MKRIFNSENKEALKFISRVTGKKKIYVLYLIILQVVLGVSSVAASLFLREVIDSAAGKDESDFIFFTALYISIILLGIILRAVARFLVEYARSAFENLFRGRLFNVLLRRQYYQVTGVHSGEWMNRLTSDTVVVSEFFVNSLPELCGMLVKMIGALVMILVLEPKFGYLFVPGAAIILIITVIFRKRIKALHKKTQEADGRVRIFIQESLESLMVIKAFATEENSEAQANEYMKKHREARMVKNRFSNVCNTGFGAAMNAIYVICLIYCGHGILIGTISYGTLFAILQLVGQVQTPLASITGYLPKYFACIASAERLIEAEGFEKEREEALEFSKVQKLYQNSFSGFSFENVTFSYPGPEEDSKPVVLSDFNLEINKGDFVALTGLSGCGKSTVLKLIMSLYPPDKGERYIIFDKKCEPDKKTLQDVELLSETTNVQDMKVRERLTEKHRRFFAYVPQGNHLMSGTIRDVVAFTDKTNVDEDRLEKSLELACADFVRELPDGVDTLLGEHGTGLSEGQMQRLAIARALYSGNPVLILDEATSALDEQTEKKVLENVKAMTDKTVLIVTHRPAGLAVCNKRVKFGEGL